MSETLTRIALAAAGVVHLLPVTGLLGARQLERLYGIAIADPGLILLMRHRAVLFGLLGAGLLAAIAVPPLRTAMLVAGLVSAAAFCVLAFAQADLAPALRRVAWIDAPVVLALAVALTMHLRATIGH